jgi:calcineurin-like phosphoesterase family protein
VTVWFTSDPHWGHSWGAHLRGFGNGGPQDREAHDATLLENFQSMVKPGDQVWWLGDLSMGRPEYALEMTSLITGHHHLILGNHDEANPLFRDSYKHQRRYMEVFESVQTHARRRVNGHEVLLSHFPYAGLDGDDHTDMPRYTQYRLPNEGRWLLHGHTHNKDQRVHGKQLHVGLDAWGMRPVSLDYIQKNVIKQEEA